MAIFTSGTSDIGGGYNLSGNLKDFRAATVDTIDTSAPDDFQDCCSTATPESMNEFVYMTMGQAGTVFVDSAAVNQPRFIVPNTLSLTIHHAYVTAGIPSNSGSIDVEFYATPVSGCGAPVPGSAEATISLPENCAYAADRDWETSCYISMMNS